MKDKCCMYCDNLIACGEGDHICGKNDEVVIVDYEPSDDYMWCNGKYFKEDK